MFERYKRTAVLLYRPFPPHKGPVSNSKFGGKPNLPPHYEWPRTSAGLPLHFLAQIDCTEIKWDSHLPDQGMLFFFGRDDDEQVWGYGPVASDDCAVIYIANGTGSDPGPVPPADLLPIGSIPQSTYGRRLPERLVLKGEANPNTHVEWPIQALAMTSWPDASALPETGVDLSAAWRRLLGNLRGKRTFKIPLPESRRAGLDRQAYEQALPARRAEAFVTATGQPAAVRRGIEQIGQDTQIARRIFEETGEGGSLYPDYWIFIHSFSRAVLCRHRARSAEGDTTIDTQAEIWLERSLQASHTDAVSLAEKVEFRDWVMSIRRNEYDPPSLPPLAACDFIRLSLIWSIRHWAHDRQLAATIPLRYYTATGGFFSLVVHEQSEDGSRSFYHLGFSQMLGHAPSAQQALDADHPTVCLLNLSTDHGLGWMFGDVGNCTFWISPADLEKRDFSQVWGTIEGH